MLITYLKTTVRYLWRQRLFTGLNILGLAIGLAASWVIYRVVDYEFSFEKNIPGKEKVVRLITGVIHDEVETLYGGVSAPIYQAISEEVPGVELAVPVFGLWNNSVEIPREAGKSLVLEEQDGIVAIRPEYFQLVPYNWLAGNPETAFQHPESVVLTESRANQYFSNLTPEQILGKELLYDGDIRKVVSGIIRDLEYPSEFTGQEFFYLKPEVYPLNAWTNTNGSDKLYLRLHEDSDETIVLEQINRLSSAKWDEFNKLRDDPLPMRKWYGLLPLTESHFSTHVSDYGVRKASYPVVFGLIGVGILLLFLACINYINLSTAQLPQRSKNIGVRKTLGSGRGHLIGQILSETFLTVLVASVVAIGLSQLASRWIADIVPAGSFEYINHTGFLFFLLLLVLLTTLLSGVYPAWLIARVRPISIMRGPVIWSASTSRFTLRKGLIVFQFAIAQLFIVGALIVGQQLAYTLKKDMGFDKEAVILITIPWKIQRDSLQNGKSFALVEELKQYPGIQQVSLGREPLTPGYSSSPFMYTDPESNESRERQLSMKWVDTTYIHLYDMELVAGRNLRYSTTPNEYVINETAARMYGFQTPGDAIGKYLARRGQSSYPIVGVVKDFHTKDFYAAMEPVVLMQDHSNLGTINIKLNTTDPSQWQKSLSAIEQKWYAFYPPDTFSFTFYDDSLEALYKQERNLAKLINLATGIAIVISCLGLFGLASLTAFQRTKEIGIRKVMGAGVAGIVAMLSRDFVKLVMAAILVSSPLAWWVMDQWLEDFAYRIAIEWWMFAAAGMVAVCIAMLTVSFQSFKAAMQNPVDSLRSE